MEGVIPKTLNEALSLMASKNYIPVAGGTDLMVRYKRWKNLTPSFPAAPLFIANLPELRGIYREDDELIIKAATPLSDIEGHSDIPVVLKEAVRLMASPGIRNIGTIGGNVGNASPAGDTLPPLYVLDANVVLLSEKGKRTLRIYEFIKGPGKNDRREDEIIYEIRFKVPEYTHYFYRKVGTRKANALSKLSFAGIAKVENGIIEDFRISLGAVAPFPVRVIEIERKVVGKKTEEIDGQFIDSIKKDYEPYIRPIDDQRSTAYYRKKTSLRLIESFLRAL